MGTLVIFAILALWRLSRPDHGSTWQALWWALSRILIFEALLYGGLFLVALLTRSGIGPLYPY